MAAPALTWRDASNVLISSALTFNWTGTATAAQVVRLWNDYGGSTSDDATGVRIKALVRDPGETHWQSDTREFVARRYAEMRITGGLGGLSVATTDWTPLGADSYLPVGVAIPQNQGVAMELRVNGATDATTDSVEVLVRALRSAAESTTTGHTEATPDGVMVGVGDGTITQLVRCAGDVVENPGGQDDYVQIQDMTWVAEGRPYCVLQQLIQLNQNDVTPTALSAGEAYYAILSLATDGTVTTTKGTKNTTPLSSSDEPTLPTGEIEIALVRVDYDAGGGAIADADITNRYVVGAYNLTSSALVATIGPGAARVDNAITRHDNGQNVTLTASSENYIWRLRDGSLSANTTGTRPTTRALLLWQATTDGSGVTASTDRRRYVGGQVHPITLRFDATLAATNLSDIHVLPFPSGAYLRPLGGIVVALDDQGSGNSSGSSIFDINVSEAGGSFTTIYTSQGTTDRRPTIAYNATDPIDTTSTPEDLHYGAHCRVQAQCDAIPAGGTAPSGATIVLLCEVRGD